MCPTISNHNALIRRPQHPRPTVDHHLHLLFSEDEDRPRFVWLYDKQELKQLVVPQDHEIESSSFFDDKPIEHWEDDYRHVKAFHTSARIHVSEVKRNRSLGMAAVGCPARSMKGNLLLSAYHYLGDESKVAGDVMPGDAVKLLESFRLKESVTTRGLRSNTDRAHDLRR